MALFNKVLDMLRPTFRAEVKAQEAADQDPIQIELFCTQYLYNNYGVEFAVELGKACDTLKAEHEIDILIDDVKDLMRQGFDLPFAYMKAPTPASEVWYIDQVLFTASALDHFKSPISSQQ